MKKIISIASIITIIFSAFSVQAQDNDKPQDNKIYEKSYIGLYGGISNPNSNYGSTNYSNNKSGFAKRGVTFGIDGAVYVYKNLAVGYTLTFQDQGKLTYDDTYALAQGYTNSYSADATSVTATGRYHNWNILIGPQYSFVYHKFVLDLRASGGLIKIFSTPETSVQLTGIPDQTAVFYQRKASAFVLGYGGSAGLRWKFSDNWTVALKGAYVSSPGPSVKNDNHTDVMGRYVTKLPISEFQTMLGLTLNF
ncbi:hypothetical protein [Mucilaginibacter sp.]|jgi:hypothetical protein|uniref:hypothetical protein n=1 Tax=Mucilaginibacter sp. TaxID=1882438 RepID=UPI002B75D369|nr:hypothetical protein [Mucilaginibacter sp.]HTI58679.1 hypothetical protein [Mucilaginibacter sp.]